jgi:hypothetical protein
LAGEISDGFVAGYTQNGEKIYIGKALFNNQYSANGLHITDSNLGPGLYYAYARNVYVLKYPVDYLIDSPAVSYSWAQSSHGQKIPNAIEIIPGFYIGRTNDSGSIYVGQIEIATRQMNYAFFNHERTVDSYEVLVCK